jgi:hypothetical protein
MERSKCKPETGNIKIHDWFLKMVDKLIDFIFTCMELFFGLFISKKKKEEIRKQVLMERQSAIRNVEIAKHRAEKLSVKKRYKKA